MRAEIIVVLCTFAIGFALAWLLDKVLEDTKDKGDQDEHRD